MEGTAALVCRVSQDSGADDAHAASLASWLAATSSTAPGRGPHYGRLCIKCGDVEECSRQSSRTFVNNAGQPTVRAQWRYCGNCTGKRPEPFQRKKDGEMISEPVRWAYSAPLHGPTRPQPQSAVRGGRLLHPARPLSSIADPELSRESWSSWDDREEKLGAVYDQAAGRLEDAGRRIEENLRENLSMHTDHLLGDLIGDFRSSAAVNEFGAAIHDAVDFEIDAVRDEVHDLEVQQFHHDVKLRSLDKRTTDVEKRLKHLEDAEVPGVTCDPVPVPAKRAKVKGPLHPLVKSGKGVPIQLTREELAFLRNKCRQSTNSIRDDPKLWDWGEELQTTVNWWDGGGRATHVLHKQLGYPIPRSDGKIRAKWVAASKKGEELKLATEAAAKAMSTATAEVRTTTRHADGSSTSTCSGQYICKIHIDTFTYKFYM